MSVEVLLGVLAFGTLGAVVIFAWRSQAATERRRHSDKPKSTLAADAPNEAHGKPVDT